MRLVKEVIVPLPPAALQKPAVKEADPIDWQGALIGLCMMLAGLAGLFNLCH